MMLLNLGAYGQNRLHQFPRSKSVTSWRGQKSVVSCRSQNSITTTCCRQVGSFPVYTRKLRGNVCNGFCALVFMYEVV